MTAGPHTAGTIRIKHGKTLISDADSYPLFNRVRKTNGEAEARANLERVRECWNACGSLTLEQVERLGKLLAAYNGDEVEIMLTESGV